MSERPTTLKEQFKQASKAKRNVDGTTARSGGFSKILKDAIGEFEVCQLMVDRLALYSTNEALEDVSTASLKFMAVKYWLASLQERYPMDENNNRLGFVQEAAKNYVEFLDLLDSYGILLEEQSIVARRLSKKDGEVDFSQFDISDAAERRANKIARFKREKELESNIKRLNEKYSIKGDDVDEYEGEAEEQIRALELAKLRSYAFSALNSLETLNMEVTLIKARPPPEQQLQQQQQLQEGDDRSRPNEKSEETLRIDLAGSDKPLLSKTGKINRPFTIVSSRVEAQRKVFGTGQYLPTMSVEEYIDEEIKRGGILPAKKEPVKQDEDDNSADEDDEAKADEETYKARYWDDFTESNPKGSGNTINKG